MNKITKINLSKLRTCNQVWEDMPKFEKGRLCLKCNNTIIDFRKMSDIEVAETHLFTEGQVCGVYTKKQLQAPNKKKRNKKVDVLNSFYVGLLSFLSINSYSQEELNEVKTEQTEKKYTSLKNVLKKQTQQKDTIVDKSIYISGQITDELEGLPEANVIIKGTKKGTTANFDGFYELDITEELDSFKKITLVYSYIGSENTEIEITPEQVKSIDNRTFNVELKLGTITEYAVPATPTYKKVWYAIKNLFRKKENRE